MYDVRCTMYDCQIRARCAGKSEGNSAVRGGNSAVRFAVRRELRKSLRDCLRFMMNGLCVILDLRELRSKGRELRGKERGA